MLSLSVIIVNYNVKYFLEQCLCSVRRAGQGLDLDIRVVDNASSDGSRAYLSPRFPDVIFYWGDANLGFARANNKALEDCRGDLVLFLNPDTILPEDCFRQCLQYFTANPRAGAIGMRMLDGSGRFLRESKRGFPEPVTALYKLTGLATLFPKSPVFARYHLGHLDPLRVHAVDVLAGAFMMVRKKVLDQTGGFDEAFFMYGEDIDLSYRIRQAGWENIYYPLCPILHFKGESTRKGSLNYVRMFYGAMAVFARKHYGDWRANAFGLSIQLAILVRGSFSAFAGMLKKSWMAIRSLAPSRARPAGNLLVVAGPDTFDRIRTTLNKKPPVTGQMVLYTLPDAGVDTAAWAQALVGFLEDKDIMDVILCEDLMGFRDIIALAEGLPAKIRLRIHAKGSDSLVGSGMAVGLDGPRVLPG